ncbi:MAG: hypothetical protein IJT36_03170 [Alphaproteobacteria bacterium]|nr:hypothetical protein [Alphaproteobacteria bacterium]
MAAKQSEGWSYPERTHIGIKYHGSELRVPSSEFLVASGDCILRRTSNARPYGMLKDFESSREDYQSSEYIL